MSIQLREVSKSFGSFQALKSLNLTIAKGEFVAILGPSGCGKTTLLRLLAGFEQPTTGEICMNETQVAKPGFSLPPEKRRIGMVFQAFALWPHMNVTEHVRFPIRHHQETPPSIRDREQDRIADVLQMVGLSEHGGRMPHELSGGQKQRVAIARAIAAEPSLLLMDEPLSSLDAMLRMDMRREIQSVHRQTGTAIVYVTHDQGEALAMADRIVVMKDGRIEQEGTPQDIYLRPQTEFVAKFVAKANLVRGRWNNGIFVPMSSDGTVQWAGPEVAPYFQACGMYPVRPDQFELCPSGTAGIRGEVTNVQFQGREYHYHIQSEDGTWEICSPLSFRRGDNVSLRLLQTSGSRQEALTR
ncbi:Spermidine/putrescine import ATP-binding protein PotA [Paenibacillus konkukensis]|uniref:Spermidine/putrescine import ATP-binding protein PotA n=1 Tax=Paenibacillus konkukensis TaxID=2020716 RepID=A0ABY4RNH8_9BACL|nr:ABC transporter ATP-binding protein [Paenibacillus konkukensis]UQZ83269.1 Spermidine/putrescine import ATP-binding protein PotA [Paenibacillus konkukensis]